MMLGVVKGTTTYEQIRLVNGQLYSTFREACFAMGYLVDDKEYIEALEKHTIGVLANSLEDFL